MSLIVHIVKKYKDFTLQSDFEAGDETLALLGASGSGKSVTLRCIAGVEKPDRGIIVLNGRTIFDSSKGINLRPQERNIGLMFQNYALFPQMTVYQNVMCGAKKIRNKSQQEKAIRDVLETLGIAKLENRLPSQLSGGQQQRTALARILVGSPEILMLDEPFAALDSHLRFRIEQEVRGIIREFGKTVLLVSHDRDEVYRMADRVAILNEGRIELIGSRDEVFSSPCTNQACLLTGCKNVSSARVVDRTHILAEDWGITLCLPVRDETDGLGLRTNAIQPGEGENTFLCDVEGVAENPLTYTVLLHPAEAPDTSVPLAWEISKNFWQEHRAEQITIHIPADRILQLKG